jgi:multiple sugar transport system ATP-binding protein
VDVVELMGNEILVYLVNNNGNNFVGRVDPRSKYVIGETSEVIFNMDNCHIFDPSENPENPVAIR